MTVQYDDTDVLHRNHKNSKMYNQLEKNQRKVQLRKRKRRNKILKVLCFHLIFSFLLSLIWLSLLIKSNFINIFQNGNFMENNGFGRDSLEYDFQSRLCKFADENHLELSDWPDELIKYGVEHPELEEFVLYFPLEYKKKHKIDLKELENSPTVPLLLQWDKRWGYEEYAGELFGMSGCGPSCLSMVAIYLFNDASFDPNYMRKFSQINQYEVEKNGSSWNLISEGGRKIGLDVIEIPLSKERIFDNLAVGNPIICNVGPGDFTTTGHFIVLSSAIDGKIKVNDPNSIERSEKLWSYEEIENQIRNLWVFRL